MPIFHTTSGLSNPIAGEEVPSTTFAYFRTRNRMHAFDLVHKEFRRAGISQAELALRLGKGPDRVCRLLGAPGNWTLDTASDLLFAISGAEVKYYLSYPLEKPHQNSNAAARGEQIFNRGSIGIPSAYPDVSVSGTGYVVGGPSITSVSSISPIDLWSPRQYEMNDIFATSGLR
jgi:hypothetical protein